MLASAPTLAAADTLEPSQWPEELALGSSTSALRFGGVDRYWTSSAMALALRGGGSMPFDSPDTHRGAGSLAEASSWWGAGSCPRSVILVAGDTPADALAAASLSDPTNRSDEPRLERVASRDPFFDPIGGFDRVDTAHAPIIVTTSARDGGAALAPSARVAVSDLRAGGCTTAREAIIVGGDVAVPSAVESELVSLGYEEVFRVAGLDRYDTAARIATALGTEPVPDGADCGDEDADDGTTTMTFHANSVIEYRPSAKACELHGRTVVLADGVVGADALAAGWWTSYWQVPVLLVDGDGSLPSATRTALQTMAIDTIVVLGGVGRVPEDVADEASRLAGNAAVGRFDGEDRYATSVETAIAFGGWYPTTDPTDFDGDRVCIAASTGATVGWPDALASGPLCGRLSAAATPSPPRALEPVVDATGAIPTAPASHDAVPVLLVPGGAAPTSSVVGLLSAAFPSGGGWCRAGSDSSCRTPGFAVAFGGSGVVSDAALDAVSSLLEGRGAGPAGALPSIEEPFLTRLDLGPVASRSAPAGELVACVDRGAYAGARWLASYGEPALHTFGAAVDLVVDGSYAGGVGRAACVGVRDGGPDDVLAAVSPAGRVAVSSIGRDPDRDVRLSEAMRHDGPLTSGGADGTTTTPGAATTWRFRDAPSGMLAVTDAGESWTVASASTSITLTREEGGRARFTGVVRLEGGEPALEGQVRGEAVLGGDGWELAGRVVLADGAGGFRASLLTNTTPDRGDDVLVWRLDAARGP
jgi:hypothetical protein